MQLFDLLFLLAVSTSTHAAEWQGSARVINGDTLVLGEARLRLVSIDAPESAQTCRDAQGESFACGRQATHELERLIDGRDVRCAGDKRDRYGRALVVCHAGQVNLNAAMVQSGWAVAYLGPQFQGDEADARLARRGLWAGDFTPPAEWRRQGAK